MSRHPASPVVVFANVFACDLLILDLSDCRLFLQSVRWRSRRARRLHLERCDAVRQEHLGRVRLSLNYFYVLQLKVAVNNHVAVDKIDGGRYLLQEDGDRVLAQLALHFNMFTIVLNTESFSFKYKRALRCI